MGDGSAGCPLIPVEPGVCGNALFAPELRRGGGRTGAGGGEPGGAGCNLGARSAPAPVAAIFLRFGGGTDTPAGGGSGVNAGVFLTNCCAAAIRGTGKTRGCTLNQQPRPPLITTAW